jgi:hypothetical protein
MEESSDEDDVPEGAVRFELDAAEIEVALSEVGMEIEAREDVDVPDALLPEEAVQALVAERQPAFVPIDGSPAAAANGSMPHAAGHGGVVQLRLSNGIKVNYRRTDNEPRGAMLRLVAAGGRATEGQGAGPLGTGVMALGTRTLSEAGTVGAWSREQVGLAAGWVWGCQSGIRACRQPTLLACHLHYAPTHPLTNPPQPPTHPAHIPPHLLPARPACLPPFLSFFQASSRHTSWMPTSSTSNPHA